jgi:hypothetical protein
VIVECANLPISTDQDITGLGNLKSKLSNTQKYINKLTRNTSSIMTELEKRAK